jgi:hypothetical protein
MKHLQTLITRCHTISVKSQLEDAVDGKCGVLLDAVFQQNQLIPYGPCMYSSKSKFSTKKLPPHLVS